MTTPTINPDSEELEMLMSQLEAETGVSAVAVPGAAPAAVAPTSVVVEDELGQRVSSNEITLSLTEPFISVSANDPR